MSAILSAGVLRSEISIGQRPAASENPAEMAKADTPRQNLAKLLQARLDSIRALTTKTTIAAAGDTRTFSVEENFRALLSVHSVLAFAYDTPFWLEAIPVTTEVVQANAVQARKPATLKIARR